MKIIVAFAAIVIVLFSTVASATNLSLRGGTIQAGSDEELQCDFDGVEIVEWHYDTAGKAVAVTVGGIDGWMENNFDVIVVLKKDGVFLEVGRLANVTASTVVVVLDAPVNGSDVNQLDVYLVTGVA